ncbi:hypothetical protein T4B_13351 [Trichinella pseudospiralis]|uniref:Uncharacterized protein n=2 Tax=Trichinella pseudospiralis TaxID=6337 RepID=A0A0V1FY90_TRIPS|nr:hypothetical protein T4D_10407 [Trichinella pseudospiralis]KRZ28458.1 hypothetical protein T4B_13351 [Trichinella pseudospiralis]KRZ44669.1 hypothetical protein T4C_5967 [Trichinella pseudospiralis]
MTAGGKSLEIEQHLTLNSSGKTDCLRIFSRFKSLDELLQLRCIRSVDIVLEKKIVKIIATLKVTTKSLNRNSQMFRLSASVRNEFSVLS